MKENQNIFYVLYIMYFNHSNFVTYPRATILTIDSLIKSSSKEVQKNLDIIKNLFA